MSDEEEVKDLASVEETPEGEAHEQDTGETDNQEESSASDTSEDSEGEITDASSDDDEGEKQLSRSQKQRLRRKEHTERLRVEAAEKQARIDRITKAGEAEQPPKYEDFETETEYAAAKAVYDASRRRDQREIEELRADHEHTTRQISEAAQQSWFEQEAEARVRYKDFDEVVHNPRLPITPDMTQVMLGSDRAADIAYYLGKNPGKAHEIANASPMEMARQIGAIEARLQGSVSRPKPAVPEPIKPVSGKGQTKARTPQDAQSYDEYRKIRMAQMKGG